MSQDLKKLYRSVVLEHNRSPRNFGAPKEATHHAEGNNPLCGDRVELFVNVSDGAMQRVSFVGEGCAICTASASLMTEIMQGKSTSEAKLLQAQFFQLLSGELTAEQCSELLGELVVFAGVTQYPARIKCANLAWHTLQAALEDSQETVSTE